VPWTFGVLFAALASLAGASSSLFGACGPFTDVTDAVFCPFVLEIFTLGITTGTTAATYDPTGDVSRLQMAAFLARTVDQSLRRGSRRTARREFFTPQNSQSLGVTALPGAVGPTLAASDGADVWVSNPGAGVVYRVRSSDGVLQETWTGATGAKGVLSAMGQILVTGRESPGLLYRIDPSQSAGAVTTVSSQLGNTVNGIAFDGSVVWTANGGGSISRLTPSASIPWTVTTTSGFPRLEGILYDGANIWVADFGAGTLLKLDGSASVLQTVTVGGNPFYPAFDGTNIWVPTGSQVSVVRASSGAILATLTGNGVSGSHSASFDGERVLVTNISSQVASVWKAADLSEIGFFPLGAEPLGVCSDGANFWIALVSSNQLARF